MTERAQRLIGVWLEVDDLAIKAMNKILAIGIDEENVVYSWFKGLESIKDIDKIMLRVINRNVGSDKTVLNFIQDVFTELKAPEIIIKTACKDEDVIDLFEIIQAVMKEHTKDYLLLYTQMGLIFDRAYRKTRMRDED